MQNARYIVTSGAYPLPDAEALSDALSENIQIDALAISIAETDEIKNLWTVIAYFATHSDAEVASRFLGPSDAAISTLPDTDWVRQSLQGLAPVVAGRFFLYGSHDRHRKRLGGISLELDAQTAFGTGHHGTTLGCLAAFDRIAKFSRPQNVLDLGTGTGVLALAAAKLHPRHIIASDIDPVAVVTARANARHNGIVQDFHTFCAVSLDHNTIKAKAPYDLIFANILARPLAKLARDLTRVLAPGGHLILSGLTADQIRWIKASYIDQGLGIAAVGIRQNWATLVMRRNKKPGTFPRRARFS
jgi:ribosomal protein L11 methyltransferase